MVVISLHLVSALSRSRMRRRVSGYFRGASNSSRQLMFASRLPSQQKENRCALMSTADYSCNVARKRAPPQLGSRAPLLRPFRMADRERVSVQTHRQERKKTTTQNPTIVHTHSTLEMPSFPNIEVCHLRFISFSAGGLALARETFECLLDVMH